MDESVLKKVCGFLQKQKDNEATFSAFWEGTNGFYPPGMSKTKVKAWLKERHDRFLITANASNKDPFGKIKLKVALATGLPSTSKREDKKITQKLIEFIDGEENGHLYAVICSKKADIFPEKMQDKKYIKQWLIAHEHHFKMVTDAHGGLFAIELTAMARNLKIGPGGATGRAKPAEKAAVPQTEDQLLKMADELVLKILQAIESHRGTMPIENLIEAKHVIYPLCDKVALKTFLANFPSTFELINIPGIGEWVRMKTTVDAVDAVVHFIFEHGGVVPFSSLLEEAKKLISSSVGSPEALSKWLKANAGVFEVISKQDDSTKPSQVRVKLPHSPWFCQTYITHGKCERKACAGTFLHICKAYVCQPLHGNDACALSHDIRDSHNKVIIDKMGALAKETDAVIVNVLRKSGFPRVCTEYNKIGKCPRGENCHFLHVCGSYVLNQCSGCLLSHEIAGDLHNIELLKRYAMLPSKKMSVEMVKTNIAYAPKKSCQPNSSIGSKEKSKLQSGAAKEKRKRRRRNRRRKAKSDEASSTMDNSSSDRSDSSSDIDDQSVCSSSHSSRQAILSLENIQKGNLAAALSGDRKVENWIGFSKEQVSDESASRKYPPSDDSSSCNVSTRSSGTQKSLWRDDFAKKVFLMILSKYNGSAPFKSIMKEKNLFNQEGDAEKWFNKHRKMFILHRNGQGKIDSVSVFSVNARLCLDYSGKKGGCDKLTCAFFHVCRDFIEGRCSDKCHLNHDMSHEQISAVAKRIGLQELTESQLNVLLSKSVPTVCKFHNGTGCNRGNFCPNMHVCKEFIKGGGCKAKACKYGHEEALKSEHAVKLLQMYHLYGKNPNFCYIRKMIFVFNAPRKQSQGQQDGNLSKLGDEAVEKTAVALMDVDLTGVFGNTAKQTEVSTPETRDAQNICPRYLTGKCRRKKCQDVHFALPYCWQFKTNAGLMWQSFEMSDCEIIEKFFCEVNTTATTLNISTGTMSCIHLDFQSMSGHQAPAGDAFAIRRLECRDGEPWCQTHWTWYKLEGSKWTKYEETKANLFEEVFLDGRFQPDSTLRRRPSGFITGSEVTERKRAKQEEVPAQPTTPVLQSPLPREPSQLHAFPESVPSPPKPVTCYRSRVEPGTAEYKDVEKCLCDSMNGVVVNQIEKIVNDDLWTKYKSKKKSMTDELRPGEGLNERRVFIPCLDQDIKHIMEGNVCESSIVGHQPLGLGSYFTSKLSLCLQWCQENSRGSRFLILCQVLTGSSTTGSPGLREFPRRENGVPYDSLVDNCEDPSVFVVKDINQCYPTLIIDFTYTQVEASSRDFETVSHEGQYTPVSPTLPTYQQEPHRISTNTHPLAAGYGSTFVSPGVAQQSQATSIIHMGTTLPSVVTQPQTTPTGPDFVKAAPPYSERPTHPECVSPDPPPEYTEHPTPNRPLQRNSSQVPTAQRRNPEKKDCVVM